MLVEGAAFALMFSHSLILPFSGSQRYDRTVPRAIHILALLTISACSPPERRLDPTYAPAITSRSIVGYEAHYLLHWRDARIGDASETVRRRDGRLRYQRHERLSLRRGDDVVAAATYIDIDIDMSLRSSHIAIEQISGPQIVRGSARRASETEPWLATFGNEPPRELPADVIPAELVPLRLFVEQKRYQPGDVAFHGRVMLAGFGFALARMKVVAEDDRAFVVTVTGESMSSHAATAMRGHWHTTRYGSLARARSHNGVSAIRVHRAELDIPFDAPEIVDATSVSVHGTRPAATESNLLIIESVQRAPPPPLPGQRVTTSTNGWRVHLYAGDRYPLVIDESENQPDPDATGQRFLKLAEDIVSRAQAQTQREQVLALTRATDTLLDDDLSAPTTHARAALALGRGDCTSHALLFQALASARGIRSKLVTGYRLDAGRLVRHRWAIAAVDGVWIAVDPTYGEAPARPVLLGLAVHGGSSPDLAFVDETVFIGLSSAHVYYPSAE